MNQTLTLLIVFTTFLFSLSCSDNENDNLRIEQKIDDKWVSVQSLSLGIKSTIEFRIRGENGSCQVFVTDSDANSKYSEIASVGYNETDQIYKVVPFKTGSTTVTITDIDHNSIKVPLTVIDDTRRFYINQLFIRIEGVSETEKVVLMSELEKSLILNDSRYINFIYNLPEAGKITIIDKDNKELYTGVFTEEWISNKYIKYVLTFSNVQHIYVLSVDGSYPEVRSSGPIKGYLTEDFTTKYKEKYPDLTVAQIIMQTSWFR